MKELHATKRKASAFKRIANSEEAGTMLVFLKSIFFLASASIGLATVVNLFYMQGFEADPAKVAIEGNKFIPSDVLLEDAGISGKTNWDIDLYEISARVGKHPWVDDVFVKRVYPDQIRMEVKEREPIAFYRLPDFIYLISEDFHVLPAIYNDQGWNLPVVSDLSIKGRITPGEVVSYPSLSSAMELLKLVKINSFLTLDMVSEIDISDPFNIQLIGIDNSPRVLLGYEDFATKLQNMFYAIPELQKLQNLRVIDLRYKNKVIAK